MRSRPNLPPARGRPRGATSFDASVAAAFGSVVRETRLATGISQELLANMAGVERSYYGRIERGESQPTLFVVLKICSALDCDSSVVVKQAEELLRPRSRKSSVKGN